MSENKIGIIIIDMWDNQSGLYTYFPELVEHYTRSISMLLDNTLGIPAAMCCYVVPEPGGPHPAIKRRCVPSKENVNRIFSSHFETIVDFFKEYEVNTLYYAGESLPGCVEMRPLGLNKLRGIFKIKIIADCTLDLFNAHKHDYDRINEMYRYMKKKNYEYVFSTDIINQFRKQNGTL